jgi:hypothetical protein
MIHIIEIEEDYLAEGNIVFLNDVDYDTSKAENRNITSRYITRIRNFSATSLTGTGYGLLLNIESIIGSISIGSISIGNGYSVTTSSNPKAHQQMVSVVD